jgi:integrase
MTKVFLREKKIKDNKLSLYLDFYPPVPHPKTGKPTRREHLRLHIYSRPKNELERDYNKQTKILAETIRARRQLDVQSRDYNFLLNSDENDFLAYFQKFIDAKESKERNSTFYTWRSSLTKLKEFTGGHCKFRDVTEDFCNRFKQFLIGCGDLGHNTKASYFIVFLAVCKQATKQKLFKENPAADIPAITEIEVRKEFLTLEEVKKLAATPLRFEDLKRAALFSVYTGLRRSDILKLTWGEIHHSDEQGCYIRFRQKKTESEETLPISDEAFELCGERGKPSERVFKNFRRHHTMYLQAWAMVAGIDKSLTFHTFRHTHATLQIALGTDLYTVSKMLGHKNIRTTQIYAKIIDQKKRDAADRIKLK